MQISIKLMTGETIKFDVESGDTVDSLISKISEKESIHELMIRLLYNGKQLSGERMLSDYNIQKDSMLYMILRLRGC